MVGKIIHFSLRLNSQGFLKRRLKMLQICQTILNLTPQQLKFINSTTKLFKIYHKSTIWRWINYKYWLTLRGFQAFVDILLDYRTQKDTPKKRRGKKLNIVAGKSIRSEDINTDQPEDNIMDSDEIIDNIYLPPTSGAQSNYLKNKKSWII